MSQVACSWPAQTSWRVPTHGCPSRSSVSSTSTRRMAMLQIFSARWHHGRVRTRVLVPLTAGLAAVTVALTSCSTGNQDTGGEGNEVTLDNCDESTEFPSPAQQIFVNEGAAVSNLLELEADDQLAAVAGVREGRQDGLAEADGRERGA